MSSIKEGKRKARPLPLTHPSDVRVGGLRVDAAVLDHVREGLVHEAAVAAMVAIRSRAVDQVLRAQVHQPPGGLGHQGLQGPGGAEGPAGAAGTLPEIPTVGKFSKICSKV